MKSRERVRGVSYCYQNWVEGTVFSMGHFHFNFDMVTPWEVEVAFFGEGEEPLSVYLFGRDILINPLEEHPEYQDSCSVFALDYPYNGVTIIYFRDFDSKDWFPFSFPRQMVMGFVEQTLAVVSKSEEQVLWDLQMEAAWAAWGE